MRITATEAKNRFGFICAQAKQAPVFVEKAGRLDSVVLSASDYQALLKQQSSSAATRQQAFEDEFGDWIADQNTRIEAFGVPGEDLRPW